MSYGPPEAASAQNALAIFRPVNQAVEQLQSHMVSSAKALEAAMQMQEEGLTLNFNLVIDKTGSMHNDVKKVREGMSAWMKSFYHSLPYGIRELYGDKVRVGGSITYFKDMQWDMDQNPFTVEIIEPMDIQNEPFVSQLKGYQADNAGGNGISESSGDALIMAMDFDKGQNRLGATMLSNLTRVITQEGTRENNDYPDAIEAYKKGCKALLESGMPPQVVILVTDELAKSTDISWGIGQQWIDRKYKQGPTAFNEREFKAAYDAMPEKSKPLMIFAIPGGSKAEGQSEPNSDEATVFAYWQKFAGLFGEKGHIVDLDNMKEGATDASGLLANMLSTTLTKAAVGLMTDQIAGLLTG